MANFRNNKNNGNHGGDGDGDGDSKLPARRDYEISEPRCHVCMSPSRRLIDQLIAAGVSVSELARQFEKENLTRKSISNHKNRHLNVEQAAVRRILEERVRRYDADVENTTRSLLTRKGVLEVLLLKGYAHAVQETTVVEPREMIGIIQQLEKMDAVDAAEQVEEMHRQMNAFMDAVKAIVPPTMWESIMSEFERKLDVESQIIAGIAAELPDPGDLKFPGTGDTDA
jgi:hypothetical protein